VATTTSSASPPPGTDETFYRSFAEKKLTGFGSARRDRLTRMRLKIVNAHAQPPGRLLEIGPGHGTFAELATAAGWSYRAIEPSRALAEDLRARAFDVVEAFTPPIPGGDGTQDVIYADQVLEHMSGIDAARHWVSDARRILRPGGVLVVIVPDYLKERTFFWDVDYTHNFITTERRVRQLLYDSGFDVLQVVRSIGAATGFRRDLLAAAALFANIPGADAVARHLGQDELLFKVRKNLFETLAIAARKAG
jgi:SAM-dependent methyltransferase